MTKPSSAAVAESRTALWVLTGAITAQRSLARLHDRQLARPVGRLS